MECAYLVRLAAGELGVAVKDGRVLLEGRAPRAITRSRGVDCGLSVGHCGFTKVMCSEGGGGWG